ncbi:MAG TPA: 2OG-Fe(II) oxygenase [Xanthomonadaceae bacterium]|nr:2OG-Fe(II) oxygenase [Xanthomonadaceae bacterium]
MTDAATRRPRERGDPGSGDFIEVIDGALGRATCDAIVDRFAAAGNAKPGRVGGGVMPELKDSLDLTISGQDDWRDVERQLNEAVLKGLLHYLRRYPQALISPLMLQHTSPDGTTRRLMADDIAARDDASLLDLVSATLRPGAINLQRYAAGRGGYPYWHCELYPRDAGCDTLHRHLLWTLYLNDGFDAGETEFLFQQRKIVPKAGTLLIAPAAFTHTHRGNRPEGGDKVIATSWILFQRAEKMFA